MADQTTKTATAPVALTERQKLEKICGTLKTLVVSKENWPDRRPGKEQQLRTSLYINKDAVSPIALAYTNITGEKKTAKTVGEFAEGVLAICKEKGEFAEFHYPDSSGEDILNVLSVYTNPSGQAALICARRRIDNVTKTADGVTFRTLVASAASISMGASTMGAVQQVEEVAF